MYVGAPWDATEIMEMNEFCYEYFSGETEKKKIPMWTTGILLERNHPSAPEAGITDKGFSIHNNNGTFRHYMYSSTHDHYHDYDPWKNGFPTWVKYNMELNSPNLEPGDLVTYKHVPRTGTDQDYTVGKLQEYEYTFPSIVTSGGLWPYIREDITGIFLGPTKSPNGKKRPDDHDPKLRGFDILTEGQIKTYYFNMINPFKEKRFPRFEIIE